MPYILPHTFIDDIKALKKEYEKSRQIDLNEAQAPYFFSRFFGATDIDLRRQQIDFLMGIYNILKKNLIENITPHATSLEWQQHVVALRILVTACLFVQDNIVNTYYFRRPHSTLNTLLDKILGITPSNILDEKTRDMCLGTAEYWLKHMFPWGHDELLAQKKSAMNTPLFASFEKYIDQEFKRLSLARQQYYPITEFVTPIIARPFEIAGSTAGFMLGGVFSDLTVRDSSLLSAAVVGGSMVGVFPPSIALVVLPPMAARLLRSIYTTSMSWMMGALFRQVGEYAGAGIGRTLDWTVRVLVYIPSTIGNMIMASPMTYSSTGVRLIDGECFLIGQLVTQQDMYVVAQMPCHFERVDLVRDEEPGVLIEEVEHSF